MRNYSGGQWVEQKANRKLPTDHLGLSKESEDHQEVDASRTKTASREEEVLRRMDGVDGCCVKLKRTRTMAGLMVVV